MIIDGKEYELVFNQAAKDRLSGADCPGCFFYENGCFKALDHSYRCGHGWQWKLKPSPDWLPLDINNLPPDILVGDYEFEHLLSGGEWCQVTNEEYYIFAQLKCGVVTRYRKRQPAKPVQPSHEELAKKYVSKLRFNPGEITEMIGKLISEQARLAFIAGRKSATIPPEKE